MEHPICLSGRLPDRLVSHLVEQPASQPNIHLSPWNPLSQLDRLNMFLIICSSNPNPPGTLSHNTLQINVTSL